MDSKKNQIVFNKCKVLLQAEHISSSSNIVLNDCNVVVTNGGSNNGQTTCKF